MSIKLGNMFDQKNGGYAVQLIVISSGNLQVLGL